MITIYLSNRYFNKKSYIFLFVFVAFSGLDIIPGFSANVPIDFIYHIERWAKYFQYSSKTTLLYWVFNQAIPIALSLV